MNTVKNTLMIGTMGLALLAAGASFGSDRDAVKASDYSLDLNQASAIALQQVPGSIHEAELEKERGKVVWEVEIMGDDQKRYEVVIDANNGTVISKALEDDHHHSGRGGRGGWFDDDKDDDDDNGRRS